MKCSKCDREHPSVCAGGPICDPCYRKYKLCFSCGKHRQKYLTGLCEECNQEIERLTAPSLPEKTE